MHFSNEKVWKKAERVLKRTKQYQEQREIGNGENYELMLILKKSKSSNPNDILVQAGFEEVVISFSPFKEQNPTISEFWAYNFDDDLFDYLESGYELSHMTLDCHYNVWCTIEEWHKGDIEHVQGMHNYLGYCKRNHITKEKLQLETGYSGMDVMNLYDKKLDRIIKPKNQER